MQLLSSLGHWHQHPDLASIPSLTQLINALPCLVVRSEAAHPRRGLDTHKRAQAHTHTKQQRIISLLGFVFFLHLDINFKDTTNYLGSFHSTTRSENLPQKRCKVNDHCGRRVLERTNPWTPLKKKNGVWNSWLDLFFCWQRKDTSMEIFLSSRLLLAPISCKLHKLPPTSPTHLFWSPTRTSSPLFVLLPPGYWKQTWLGVCDRSVAPCSTLAFVHCEISKGPAVFVLFWQLTQDVMSLSELEVWLYLWWYFTPHDSSLFFQLLLWCPPQRKSLKVVLYINLYLNKSLIISSEENCQGIIYFYI